MSRDREPISYAAAYFASELALVDPRVDMLIKLEEERQKRRIILIPSESYAPLPVRQALGSVFTNVYAEGYPPSQMLQRDEGGLADLTQELAYYRRYADRRFYKGADYVHFVEALAQRRAAACLANGRVEEGDIFVNVQPLSGAAANLSVYDALIKPGDMLMGMDLYQGGHLTHGSEFNVSGKRYKVVSYGVRESDGLLDYDEIRRLARQHRPKVIVAGYTSYPWAPDFGRFREIADEVGAYLFADISHTAGMAIAGQYPNPVGIADVTTFTTHKTLCGPRGACIVTTDAALSRQVDRAVFPGMQGGPHTNKFAAMCVAFEIARSDVFADLQARIVENAQALAKGLSDRGLGLAYGGTNTHLLLLDLKSVPARRAGGAADEPLYGEVVARILELAGIVVNKNTIPGDVSTPLATGIRMGTPWVSQRGMGPAEMDTLAACIDEVVRHIVPFSYEGQMSRLPRGKIDLEALERIKWVVDDMASAAESERTGATSSYPHYSLRPRQAVMPEPLFAGQVEHAEGWLDHEVALIDLSDVCVLRVSGWRARPFLDDLCTADISGLEPGEGVSSFVLDKEGRILDDIALWRMETDDQERDVYLMFASPEGVDELVSWMRAVSDGYVLFDDSDVWRKVRGPAKVEVLSEAEDGTRLAIIVVRGPRARQVAAGVLGIDLETTLRAGPDRFNCLRTSFNGGSLWVVPADYDDGGEQVDIVGPVGLVGEAWDALARAGAVPVKAPEARHTLRQAAGLPVRWPASSLNPLERTAEAIPDSEWYMKRFPARFCMSKPYFVGQNKLPEPAREAEKVSFAWAAPAQETLKRTPLYEEHVSLGAKMVPFAGWEMPVWYSSVSEEHQAVRETAGLFDVAHMGTLEVSGPHAVDLLDAVGVNYVWWIEDGESQYSGLLDEQGRILDDVIIYRRAWDRFFVVVNAANFDKDWAWLNAVNANRVLLDRDRPWVSVLHPARLRDLKDRESGRDQRVDLALQGPRSLDILLACIDDRQLANRLGRLQRTQFVEGTLGGLEALISRTGYTGEKMGFEVYVHPDDAAALWRMLMERGAEFGIKPCGLAARDSTRIEAGLPLYGHELGGPLEVTQTEAGFGGFVKYHKPFFIGRGPYKAYNDQGARQVVRFEIAERGARAIRGGEHGEPVVNKRGKVVGTVTSCALVGDRQIGMALIEARYADPGTLLLIYPENRRAVCKPPQAFELGDTIAMPVEAVVLPRFPRG